METGILYRHRERHDGKSYDLIASEHALCYVGTPDEPLEETLRLISKKYPKHDVVEDSNQLVPYLEAFHRLLDGKPTSLEGLNFDLKGTAFQQQVWSELLKIPHGQTLSYKDVAHRIGNPKAIRATGSAIGANPVMIFIPCHRVISSSGQLTGFRGGLELKQYLLTNERKFC